MERIKYLICTSAIVLLTACSVPEKPKKEAAGCYSYEKNGDHVQLSLHKSGTSYTGEMDYSISGKDKNAGSVNGHEENGILLLNYDFDSEGTRSTRQLAFKRKGNQLIEGYGSMREENGMMVFENPAQLNFPGTVVLRKMSCD